MRGEAVRVYDQYQMRRAGARLRLQNDEDGSRSTGSQTTGQARQKVKSRSWILRYSGIHKTNTAGKLDAAGRGERHQSVRTR